MNTSAKFFRPSALILATGGLCWVIKFVVIAATDGATSGTAKSVTGVLYLTAVGLMAVGLAGLGASVLARRHALLGAVGAVVGLVVWWVSYVLIETVAKAAAGDSGPAWLEDEIGIVATGSVLMTIGLLVARTSAPPSGRRTVNA